MALTHSLVEIRQYLDGWLSKVDITDDQSGRMWHERFNTPSYPTDGELDALVNGAKTRIQKELEYEANDMNLPADEERALEYLRNIKRDTILQIRQYPGVTLAQAQAYVDANYPNSIINFDRLYQFYLNLLNLSTWDEFKTYLINHKFGGID